MQLQITIRASLIRLVECNNCLPCKLLPSELHMLQLPHESILFLSVKVTRIAFGECKHIVHSVSYKREVICCRNAVPLAIEYI